MNDLQLFNFNGSNIRTLLIEDEPYFVGNDVAEVLGYKRPGDALAKLDSNERKSLSYKAFGDLAQSLWNGNDFSNKTVINESGVYSLIFSSELPQAKEFKRWVTSEVLPTIRKHGAYATETKLEEMLNDPQTMITTLQRLKEEQDARKALQLENDAMKPKALFADAVASSKTSILIGDLAKLLKQNGIDTGQNRLFAWLRDNKYLNSKRGSSYNMPTQKSMDLGIMEIKETTNVLADGHIRVNRTPKVTGKGQQYFINKFLKKEGTK